MKGKDHQLVKKAAMLIRINAEITSLLLAGKGIAREWISYKLRAPPPAALSNGRMRRSLKQRVTRVGNYCQ